MLLAQTGAWENRGLAGKMEESSGGITGWSVRLVGSPTVN